MDRAAAIADIKRGLGYRQTQETTIIAKLQEAQRLLELGRTLPNFLLVFNTPITVTADNEVIALPTGFIRFHDDYQMYYLNSDNAKVFVPRKNYSEAYFAYVGSGAADDSAQLDDATDGYPKAVVIPNKTNGILIPKPTVSFTMYLTAYIKDEVLDANVQNLWLLNAPDVLIGLAGKLTADVLRDKDASAAFADRYKLGLGSLLGDIIEDELAGRGLVMGRNN